MKKNEFTFTYDEFNSIEELDLDDAKLLSEARKATRQSYAPYSNFRVGAAAKLSNGEFVIGVNQENASFPAGICAERALLATASTIYPGVPIDTMAISYHSGNGESDQPISPCGICRQSLQEFETRVGKPVRLILGGMEGRVFIIPDARLLLPLAFTKKELNKG